MKLHEVPKGSKLKLPIKRGKKTVEEFWTFNHVDGAYSHISNEAKEVTHLSANAPMKKVKDYYVIDEKNW